MQNTTENYTSVLTEYAQNGYLFPGEELDLAEELFPTVPVKTNKGFFDKYAWLTMYTPVDTRLSRRNTPHKIETNRTEGTWNCEPHGLDIEEWAISEFQDRGVDESVDNLQTQMGVRFVSNNERALAIVRKAVPTEAELSNWTDDTDVPDLLNTLVNNVAMGCGRPANRLLIGKHAWGKIRRHPSMLACVQGHKTALSVQDVVDDVLDTPGVTIIIAENMRADGAGKLEQALKYDVMAYYRAPAVSRNDLSFGKNFSVMPAPKVKTHEEKGLFMVNTMLWSSDMQVANANAMSRCTIN